jgi:hypothetical protein
LVALVLFGIAVLVALVKWSRKTLRTGPLKGVGLTVAAVSGVTALNEWPSVVSSFTTAQPFGLQAGAVAVGMVLFTAFLALSIGSAAGLAHTWLPSRRAADGPGPWPGVGLGLMVVGLLAAEAVMPASGPPGWSGYSSSITMLPALDLALSPLMDFLLGTTVLLLVVAALERWTRGWRERRILSLAGLFFLGVGATVSWSHESVLVWIAVGTLATACVFGLYWAARVLHWAVIPWVLAVATMAEQVGRIPTLPRDWNLAGSLLGVLLVIAVARRWARGLSATGHTEEESGGSPLPSNAEA